MASFIKNTGDIILDAVLTDEGRRRLAMGDGSFKITKFALGDDEINYSLWDTQKNSGFEDTQILYTPIMEALTNNAASMKSKLMTILETNLLYLPTLKLNTTNNTAGLKLASSTYGITGYIYPINKSTTTTNYFLNSNNGITDGILKKPSTTNSYNITVDQGLDSPDLDNTKSLFDTSPNLVENEYNVIVDSRLFYVNGKTPISIDDDYMATYSFFSGEPSVQRMATSSGNEAGQDGETPINGIRGTRLKFSIVSQDTVSSTSSDNLFKRIGSLNVKLPGISTTAFDLIRTIVRVVGVSTGCSVDVPVLIARQ